MKDAQVYLHHIVDAIEHIRTFIKGMSYDDFDQSHLVQSAVIRQFEIIGEAATKALKINRQILQDIPEVPWRKLIGMRNKLIHDYMGVQVDLIWDTIHKDLDHVDQAIQHFLKPEAS